MQVHLRPETREIFVYNAANSQAVRFVGDNGIGFEKEVMEDGVIKFKYYPVQGKYCIQIFNETQIIKTFTLVPFYERMGKNKESYTPQSMSSTDSAEKSVWSFKIPFSDVRFDFDPGNPLKSAFASGPETGKDRELMEPLLKKENRW